MADVVTVEDAKSTPSLTERNAECVNVMGIDGSLIARGLTI